MKTIGTCGDCVSWTRTSDCRGKCSAIGEDHGEYFGCIHWQGKRTPLANYPTRSRLELENEDLRSENNAAFVKIQQLSEALVALGYDPTQLP